VISDWALRIGGVVPGYRIDFGPGYRIYFGRDGDRLVILLAGGTKKTPAGRYTPGDYALG
jgi:putative addiction module killer protein